MESESAPVFVSNVSYNSALSEWHTSHAWRRHQFEFDVCSQRAELPNLPLQLSMLSVGVLHDPNHVHLTILKQSMLLLQSLEVVLKQKLTHTEVVAKEHNVGRP